MNRKNGYKNIEKWRKACNRQRLKYYRKTAFAANSHQAWSDKEIELVMRHEIPDHTISKIIGRSVQAIQIVRCKEKKNRSVSDGGNKMD